MVLNGALRPIRIDLCRWQVVFFSLLLSCAGQQAHSAPAPALGLYFVDARGVEQLIATEADLVSYDWHSHSFALKPNAIARLPRRGDVPINGIPFVWRASGEVCYRGAFWSFLSPIATQQPIIDLSRIRRSELHIELGYPPATPHFGPDPRENKRLRAALKRLHKLA